jgi:hypothetical protein
MEKDNKIKLSNGYEICEVEWVTQNAHFDEFINIQNLKGKEFCINKKL